MKKPAMANYHDKDALKVVALGDWHVGKTSVLERFAHGYYIPTGRPAIDANFHTRVVSVGGIDTKVFLEDTLEMSRRHKWRPPLSGAVVRRARGLLLIYDVADRQSFDSITDRFAQAISLAPAGVRVMVLGNKCDLEAERAVSAEEGKALADGLGAGFLEVSAKDDYNVEAAVFALLSAITNKRVETTDQRDARNARRRSWVATGVAAAAAAAAAAFALFRTATSGTPSPSSP
ncbi:P-loop containing nucleoside triphosphate hydrolase protein [Zopfochytrium polystomum]|nr:P-loop containing nucleoside triphosphate hydrolase protein [Zopfochytrium polystomum]